MTDTRAFLHGGNTPYLESMLNQFNANPHSVEPYWRGFFEAMRLEAPAASTGVEGRIGQLVAAYRTHGHKCAHVNPLAPAPQMDADLDPATYGFTAADMAKKFPTQGLLAQKEAPLKDIVAALRRIYTSTLGVQYADLPNRGERMWLQGKLEDPTQTITFSRQKKHALLNSLMKASLFEDFLHTKFVGAKRFSLEGGEAYVPMMEALVEHSASFGVNEVVLGMAHRGRLNTLVNILQKPLALMFAEFKGALATTTADMSDVKYHMGKSYDITTAADKNVHVVLLPNPSHLEAVNAVVEGSVRARQKRKGAQGPRQVLPVLIHGDAAFIGQGVVAETLNLMALEGYNTGGTIHVVINNQIGFTACPSESCGTEYCTDFARMLQVPVFHVNGEDPEACLRVMQWAAEYRAAFGRDVVIDLVCYRKYGHNEGDDPTFTQPLMYKVIQDQKSPYENYAAALKAEGSLTDAEAEAILTAYQQSLQQAYTQAETLKEAPGPDEFKGGVWKNYARSGQDIKTAISPKTLAAVAQATTTIPSGFTPHAKVWKLIEQRAAMYGKGGILNWGAAEMAAYGSLLAEGYSVRLSGQDAKRGTFSHRHMVLKDVNSAAETNPLASMAAKGATLEVWNSPLSEEAVLGFEFGHSWADPHTLTLWEAQFGDFANGAQIVIDQFIASSATKWQRYSGLVMLLPHGSEGQGPEHSSARLERYLQLCADGNMEVMNLTTPAQLFHALRRQVLRPFRRPLVIMSPKSLLRHPQAVCTPQDLTEGEFQPVIADTLNPKSVQRVALCSGKIYYEALAHREKSDQGEKVALLRLEQLYPLPLDALKTALKQYGKAEWVWLQEEPRNQGAWTYVLDVWAHEYGLPLRLLARPAAASPAVGQLNRHNAEQNKLLEILFTF